ncbi:MAG: hypothetical protein V4607_05220 [Pseudomonadota bacterium]
MNELIINDVDKATEAERTTLTIAYVLHVIGPFTAFLLNIAGLILNHIKAAETNNQYIRSHHVWMLRTFWWSLLWSIIGGVLCLILVGYVVLAIVGLWWLYRVVRGLINYAEQRPMPI